jgi:HD-like signal output (HDOD) protein
VTNKRILFVDDEASVLEGLENLLRKQRRRWQMSFALGGEAALAELQKAPFDVIVTDIRMPGMDGATLLHHVRERHPAVVRIVLSGHADREAVIRAIPVAHQFLAKPCDGEVLRAVIERTCELQMLLGDDTLREIVGRIENLPCVPAVYHELMQRVGDPTVGLAEVAGIVEKDTAMSAKILQIVNSAYFGVRQPMSSVQQAVKYLGLELIKGMALTVQLFNTLESAPGGDFSLDQMQHSSLLTARVARRLVSDGDEKAATSAFTAGLLHNVGTVVLIVGLPERFAQISREAQQSGRPTFLVERELLGVTHAEIGGYLLGTWGLPFTVVEAVAQHHSPGRVAEGDLQVLAAVHVAEALVEGVLVGPAAAQSLLDEAFLLKAGLMERMAGWRAIAEVECSSVKRAAS